MYAADVGGSGPGGVLSDEEMARALQVLLSLSLPFLFLDPPPPPPPTHPHPNPHPHPHFSLSLSPYHLKEHVGGSHSGDRFGVHCLVSSG